MLSHANTLLKGCVQYLLMQIRTYAFLFLHTQTDTQVISQPALLRSLARWAWRPDGITVWALGPSHSGDLISLHFLFFTTTFTSICPLPPFFFSSYHISPLYNHKFQKFSSLTNNCITSWYFVLYFQNPINLTAFGLLLWKVKHARSCRPFIIWLKVERN